MSNSNFNRDFESATYVPISGERSGEDSYCGGFSLKNPTSLFYAVSDTNRIKLDSNPMVKCLTIYDIYKNQLFPIGMCDNEEYSRIT